MATATAERRGVVRAQQLGAPLPPVEQQDPLPCPRCASTNTKFCYYNNYNFSQPRHFCKACRRYWTHGGTLRDIPMGGGSRKTAKRARTNSETAVAAVAATTSTSSGYVGSGMEQTVPAATAQQAPVLVSMPLSGSDGGAGGGFTSLLSGGGGGGCGGGILSLGGLGLGLGLEDVGYGLATRGLWAFPNHQHHDIGLYMNGGDGGVGPEDGGRMTDRSDTWQMESGEVVGFVGTTDCFTTNTSPLPELAISTSSNGLK